MTERAWNSYKVKTVALLIPTFNRPLSIFNLLDDLNKSFNNSKIFNFTVTIGNNGNHFSILKNYQFSVELINNKKNIGGAANVIKLLLNTNSDLIVTMGDDDLIRGNFFEALELFFTYPDLLGGGFISIRDRENLNEFSPKGKKYKLLLRGLSLSGLIFNGKVREKLTQELQEILIASHYPQLGLLLLCADIGVIRHSPSAYVLINQNNQKYWKYDSSFFNLKLFQMLNYVNRGSLIDEKSWNEFIKKRARSLFVSKMQERSSFVNRLMFVFKMREIPEFRYNKFFVTYGIGYVLLGWFDFRRRRYGS